MIYQMGKVGSATVHETLLNAKLHNPVYHIHFLSHEDIRSAERFFLSLKTPIISGHLRRSKILRQIIDNNSGVEWKIITLVREPIGRDISDLFQTIDRYHPELVDNGKIKTNQTIGLLLKNFINYDQNTNYTCTWFDKELNDVFDIDVYAYNFNMEKGYTVLSGKRNIEVLILRLEDLNRNLENALAEFLDLKNPVKILKSNVGREKQYSEAYRDVLTSIRIPESVCTKIYSTKYATHFYSEKMRQEFAMRWSKGKV
jgi:hypothetical protein